MSETHQRIDKWLWYARIYKSRTLAAKQAVSGHIRLNREKVSSASQKVKIGDVLTISRKDRILVLKVCLPGTRRGPAPEAQTLYEDLSPPPPPKADKAMQPTVPSRDPGAGRPTKRDRRVMDRFRDDASGS